MRCRIPGWTQRGARAAAALVIGVMLVAGCGPRGGSPPPVAAPPAGASGGTSAAAPASPGGDSPRIVLSPDAVHIEYHVHGSGEPTVVLVHGWANDANYWNGQLPALTARYTVVTVNLAGHGASGANRIDWSIPAFAQDVATVAREVPGTHLVLVGHGMGATVALAAAPLIGARVSGVILVEALRSVGEPPPAPAQIERELAPFRADFVGATRRLVTESLFEPGADPQLAQKVAYDMSLEPPAIAVATLHALLGTDIAPLLKATAVPVFLINSDLQPTPAAAIRALRPDVHIDVLAHSGHFLMLETPARFDPLLLADIAALARPAAH